MRIELADLPMDVEVASNEKTLRPYNRHGVQVDFKAKPSHDAIIRVLLPDGAALPAGAVVRLEGESGEFVSAPGGEVYLTGLDTNNVATASWATGSCRMAFSFKPNGEPQPNLGDVQCRP